MASLLSKEEAVRFVEDILGISDCKSLLQSNLHKLLSLITLQLHQTSPFNNFFLMALPPAERKRPSWEKVKTQMFSGAGGLCYTKNLFTFHMLRALGYEVKALMAAVGEYTCNNHLMVTVMNLKTPGDQFLVDVGVGFPCFEPVDLTFQMESPTFVQSFMKFKYVWKGNDLIRLNRDKTPTDIDDGFRKFITCPMTFYEPEEMEQYFDRVYEDPKTTRFHSVLRCTQYPGSVAKVLNDATSRFENQQHELIDYPLETDQAIQDFVGEQFPTVPTSVVTTAVKNWRSLKPS